MPKTTIRVRKKRWDFFNRECKAISLRRDDFLSRLLPGELARLADVPACDAEGARWLKDRWATSWSSYDYEIISVPVLLSEEPLQLLNSICADKQIPRDAFLDCFLEFLTARIADAALVLRDPRASDDLGSQVADIVSNDEASDQEAEGWLLSVATEWYSQRNPAAWAVDFYQARLRYDAKRVEDERFALESIELL
jgi:hypothetical protein